MCYIPYDVTRTYYYKRTYFNGAWNSDWVKLADSDLKSKLTNANPGRLTQIGWDSSFRGGPYLTIDNTQMQLLICAGEGYMIQRIELINSNPSTGNRALKIHWSADGHQMESYIDVTNSVTIS